MILSDQQATGDKFNSYIAERRSNVLLLGSSYLYDPAALSDMKRWNLTLSLPEYTGARYFDECMASRLNLSVKSFNLGLSGTTVSDDLFLLEKVLERNKIPKSIFLFVAPRDFIDHFSFYGEGSHIYQYFAQCSQCTNLCLNDKFDRNAEKVLSSLFNFFRQKGDYRRVFSTVACNALNHPDGLMSAAISDLNFQRRISLVKSYLPSSTERREQIMEQDVAIYRKRYLPVDKERFNLEIRALDELFKLASRRKIFVIVVNMPVTTANLNLLPQQFVSEYNNRLRMICKNNGVSLYDFEHDRRFSANDFQDSAHLNAIGGMKFFQFLSEALHADSDTAWAFRRAIK